MPSSLLGSAEPAGDGVNNITTSSVAMAPSVDEAGDQAPLATRGQETPYELMNGYRVGAGDRLNVRVLDKPELSRQYLVDGAGKISIPGIPPLRVAGLTAPQIEMRVSSRLPKSFLRSPSVSVQVADLRPFFILGEVSRSGSFPYRAGMTIEDAIALAGGYTARANEDKVLRTRKSADGTSTDRVAVTTQVHPGDIVLVRARKKHLTR